MNDNESEQASTRAQPDSSGLPPVAPDFVEQDSPDDIDNIVPTRGYHMTPMVGLGGSAGSVQALTEFFRAMPADSGMVFVVIMHLSPTHDSSMVELLSRATPMKVVAAEDGQKVEVNHVYVIPPGKYLAATNGHLALSELEADRGKRVAVDLFFRSLADTHGPHAAAVVLSGADGDGALGIKRIKERGGLTIAQDPDEAEYSGMPRSAIDTGMIDCVLKIAEVPNRLLEYHRSASRLRLPSEEVPAAAPSAPHASEDDEEALRDILVFLRMRTRRDFSYYKRATILRRIARRMQVNSVDDLPEYLTFLRTHPGEAGALLQDLLISVTNFFRDRDVFSTLRRHLPKLFAGKHGHDAVRVWVPACATGEEAYSIAMMLMEHSRGMSDAPALQVFASDLNEEAIQVARTGRYPDVITADVSEERLRSFFVKDHTGYHVRREVREAVLFAQHDLLRDAPFSRMDLISCRNLLIYLNQDAQRRAIETFHFSLHPDGLLLLGSSEAVDSDRPLFRVIDKKYRLYQRQPAARVGVPLPVDPVSFVRTMEKQENASHAKAPVVHGARFVQDSALAPFHGAIDRSLDRASLADLHFKLVERYAPPSVVINADNEIVHLSDHAGSLLTFIGGEPTADLLRVIHPALRVALRTALFRATESSAPADAFEVTAKIGDDMRSVQIRVLPANEIAPGYMLVVFDVRPAAAERATPPAGTTGASVPPIVDHLERELEQVKFSLRDTVEQYEASTEELKASNEELQAMNEELRSATEELETSREELQSINEELTTVNQEMNGKVSELAHANSDLQNLMASTAIATVFLDREQRITRYTPIAADLFNLIPSDIGRPLAHLKHEVDYPELIADIEQVARTLVPVEREVRADSRWYFSRIQPYRTLEDHIGGTVVTFVDVSERNRAIDALRASEERMRHLIESAKEYAIFTTDPDRRINSWNSGARALFGYADNEILGHLADELFTPEDQAAGDAIGELERARDKGFAENERWHARKDGSRFYGSGLVMPLRNARGDLRGFVKIMRDLTERKRNEDVLRENVDELVRFNAAAVGRELRMIELKKEVNELSALAGEAPRYSLDYDQQEAAPADE